MSECSITEVLSWPISGSKHKHKILEFIRDRILGYDIELLTNKAAILNTLFKVAIMVCLGRKCILIFQLKIHDVCHINRNRNGCRID